MHHHTHRWCVYISEDKSFIVLSINVVCILLYIMTQSNCNINDFWDFEWCGDLHSSGILFKSIKAILSIKRIITIKCNYECTHLTEHTIRWTEQREKKSELILNQMIRGPGSIRAFSLTWTFFYMKKLLRNDCSEQVK